jgi:hypothetical protein
LAASAWLSTVRAKLIGRPSPPAQDVPIEPPPTRFTGWAAVELALKPGVQRKPPSRSEQGPSSPVVAVSDRTAECSACSMDDRQVPLSPAEQSDRERHRFRGLAGQHHDDSRPATAASDREGIGMLDRHAHTVWDSHHLAGDVDDGADVVGIDRHADVAVPAPSGGQ